MTKIIKTIFADIDYSEYPMIKLISNGINPSSDETSHFLNSLMNLTDSQKGPFVTLVDGTRGVWISKERRDQLAMGMQYIEEKNIARQKMNFLVVPNIALWLMVKLFNLVIKSEIPQKVYFKLHKAELDAKVFIKEMMEKEALTL